MPDFPPKSRVVKGRVRGGTSRRAGGKSNKERGCVGLWNKGHAGIRDLCTLAKSGWEVMDFDAMMKVLVHREDQKEAEKKKERTAENSPDGPC